MDTYHSTSLTLRGEVNHTQGLATDHGEGVEHGHVTIYTYGTGNLTIAADTPEALRSLALAFENAADDLAAMRRAKRPVAAMGGLH